MQQRAPRFLILAAIFCLCHFAKAGTALCRETAFVRVGVTRRDTYGAASRGPRPSLSLAGAWLSGSPYRAPINFSRRHRWMFAAPALLFLFYLVSWLRIGREPRPGAVVARYEPPEGLSPAAARYIATGTTDGRSFAAVLAQLAFRGCLRVEPVNGKCRLSRLMSDRAVEAGLAPEEKRLLAVLFEDGPAIELSPAMDQRNTAQNGRYLFHIHEELSKQFRGKFLTRHSGIIAMGILATFVSCLVLAATAQGRDTTGAVFFTLWILFCGLILGLIVELSFASAWQNTWRTGSGWLKMLPGTAVIAVFGSVIVFMLQKLATGVSPAYALTLASMLLINLGWGPLLKSKSPLGRQMSEEIAGFRQFLQTVDQDRLNRSNSPGQTPQDLDRFLPYAIALEVKDAWGDQLTQTFFATTVFVED